MRSDFSLNTVSYNIFGQRVPDYSNLVIEKVTFNLFIINVV